MTRSLVWLAAFALAASLLATGTVLAEGREKVRERRKEALDMDKDGRIDHGELRLAVMAELRAVDADKDGKIDHGEGRAALQKLRERLDTDKDGKIEPGELRAALLNLKEKHPLFYERVLRRIREGRERREEWREKGEKG